MVPRDERRQKLKSMPSFVPFKKFEGKLLELEFREVSQFTVVSDGKFWIKRIYENGTETVTLSDEIGEVMHLKDPIVTIYGSSETIETMRKVV